MSLLDKFYTDVEDVKIIPASVAKHLVGQHDQRTHGSWASGETVVTSLIDKLSQKRTPGFSIDLQTKTSPKTGYIASDRRAEKIYDWAKVSVSRDVLRQTIKGYIKEHGELLTGRGTFFGGWVEKGKLYLDVSRRYDTRSEGVQAGFRNKQKAIYDVVNDSYIYMEEEVDERTNKARDDRDTKASQRNDRARTRPIYRRDSGSNPGQSLTPHVCLGRYSVVQKHLEGQHDQRTHGNWAGTRYPEDSVKSARDGALEYSFKKGLKHDETIDYTKVVANRERAAQIADVYEELPKFDKSAVDEYEALASEVEEQYDFMTKTLGVKVEFVPDDPYKTSKEMFADVSQGRLKVLQTETTGAHPLFSDEQNNKFRAVHDFFGHAATGRGFGQDGEEAAWVHHSQMFTENARAALTTETRGQNSFFNNRGKQFAEQKVALLPSTYWKVPTSFTKNRKYQKPLIIKFQAGLIPVIKHLPGQHDQATHGSWAERGYPEEMAQRLSEVQDIGPAKQDIINALEGNASKLADPPDDELNMMVDNDSYDYEQIREIAIDWVNQSDAMADWEAEEENKKLQEENLGKYLEEQTAFFNNLVEDSYPLAREEYINANRERILEQYRDLNEVEVDSVEGLQSFFEEVYNVEHTGKDVNGNEVTLRSEVEDIGIEGGRLLIQGQVYNEDGEVVSEGPGFVRSWTIGENGEVIQEHDYFRLMEQYRGTGFGKVFVDRSEDWATQAGIDKIVVGTAWDGARHWARMGYDWSPDNFDEDLRSITIQAQDHARFLTERAMNYSVTGSDNPDFTQRDKFVSDFNEVIGRAVTNPIYDADTNIIRDFQRPQSLTGNDVPTPYEFAMLGYGSRQKTSDGTEWDGKTVMAGLRLHYEKVLTPEGRTVVEGPIDRDGDGLVYDGTARERPAPQGGQA